MDDLVVVVIVVKKVSEDVVWCVGKWVDYVGDEGSDGVV